MKDVCGNELAVGDKVVTTYSDYTLAVGTVTGFTPKKIRIKCTAPHQSNVNKVYDVVKFPMQVAKIVSTL